eukprot:1802660-Rhodomonas_salina.1
MLSVFSGSRRAVLLELSDGERAYGGHRRSRGTWTRSEAWTRLKRLGSTRILSARSGQRLREELVICKEATMSTRNRPALKLNSFIISLSHLPSLLPSLPSPSPPCFPFSLSPHPLPSQHPTSSSHIIPSSSHLIPSSSHHPPITLPHPPIILPSSFPSLSRVQAFEDCRVIAKEARA